LLSIPSTWLAHPAFGAEHTPFVCVGRKDLVNDLASFARDAGPASVLVDVCELAAVSGAGSHV